MSEYGAGVIPQKGGRVALRVLGDCGVFTPGELRALALLAEERGGGRVTFTARGTAEVDRVEAGDWETAVRRARELGLRLGGTGCTVRAVVACKGTDCRKGVFDVHALAARLGRRFEGEAVPKKFKIGVFGCLNSLGKAMGQDIGVLPSTREPGKFQLYAGGRLGKSPARGRPMERQFTGGELEAFLASALDLYRTHGEAGERFRAMLDREPGLWKTLEGWEP